MTGRRRLWLWAAVVWVALVAVAGGVTLWLQDSAQPRRYGWQNADPTPSPPDGWEATRSVGE